VCLTLISLLKICGRSKFVRMQMSGRQLCALSSIASRNEVFSFLHGYLLDEKRLGYVGHMTINTIPMAQSFGGKRKHG
jgi:hypothetical protein